MMITKIYFYLIEVHKNCFCTFIIVSEIYMIISYQLYKNSRRTQELTNREIRSLRLKKCLCIINIISILLASYFFVRHNDRCEGGSMKIHTKF